MSLEIMQARLESSRLSLEFAQCSAEKSYYSKQVEYWEAAIQNKIKYGY